MTPSIRARLRALSAAFPVFTRVGLTLIALLVVANVVAAVRLYGWRVQLANLRAEMSSAERSRTDLALESAANRARVHAEVVRRQSRQDRDLHLTVQRDSSRLLLERDGVVLRAMPATLGDSAATLATGAQTVERVVGAADSFTVPQRVFTDRGMPVPPLEQRRIKAALGRHAFILSGGMVIYATPSRGPLSDSTYVLPGAMLLRSDDLNAIAASVLPGTTVYIYE